MKECTEELKAKRDDAFGSSVDFILFNTGEEYRWRFFQRKIDIYHILSCALISLLVGGLVGFVLRVVVQVHYGAWPWSPEFYDFLFFMVSMVSVIFLATCLILSEKKCFSRSIQFLNY